MRTDPETPKRELPAGLTFFPPGTDPAKKRRRRVFLGIYLLAAVLLVWPVYPLFSGIKPLILGLPLSLAWVVMALGVMFGALVWLYRAEDDDS